MTVNTTGATTFGGTVNLTSLTTNAGGTTNINGGGVTTLGTQLYNDTVNLGSGSRLWPPASLRTSRSTARSRDRP